MNNTLATNRMFLWASLVLLALGIWAAEAQAQTQVFHITQDRALLKGNEAMQSGDIESALVHYRKAVGKDLTAKERTMAFNSICAAEFVLGNAEAAAEACTAAIEGDNGYWKAFVNRGNARKALGDREGAIADYCRAHDLRPSQVSGTFEAWCDALG
ncbi:hypothetical protein [Kordiimonas sp.]|uniref:hypothetical protein n=1 Tax=Kordiimonas sp. TaxID=1970157 RepID=UPI003B523A17